jgi:hypothetical protein
MRSLFKVLSVVNIGTNYWYVQITDEGMDEDCTMGA